MSRTSQFMFHRMEKRQVRSGQEAGEAPMTTLQPSEG